MLTTDWKLQKSPPIWLWFLAFVISIAGIFIFGLNPEYLNKYWLHLAVYNFVAIAIASLYITRFITSLKLSKKQNIVGSRLTIALVKVIPILTIIPVLSFYLFSFQSVQNNLELASKSVANLNTKIYNEINNIHQDLKILEEQKYIDINTKVLKIVNSFITDKNNYSQNLDAILNRLALKYDICLVSVFFDNKEIATSDIIKNCQVWDDYKLENTLYSAQEKDNIFTTLTQLPLKSIKNTTTNIVLVAFYRQNTQLGRTIFRVNDFKKGIKSANITLNSAIIQKQFLLDFSTTILLTLLSILIIVFKMVERIMIPLNNLNIASKKISSGQYGALAINTGSDKDIKSLINEFNNMSIQIKQTNKELDTKNIYLETVIKYSSGIITMDNDYKITLINNKILDLLNINEINLTNSYLKSIATDDDTLKKVLSIIINNFESHHTTWRESLEFGNLLLDIRGAILQNSNKNIGYMVIITDITDIKKTQKLIAWNEVAKKMAHEIKNPLNPILINAQRLRNKFLQNKNISTQEIEIIDKTTGAIITQVSSISELVTSFANYNNKQEINYSKQDLNEIITGVALLFENNCNLDLQLGKISNLNLNKNSLNRVLINLIKNSIEATINKKPYIIIKTQEKNTNIILEILDNGTGFDTNIVDKVFEPYVTNKTKGSGLGMAIVSKIIKQHNATIEIDENYTKGAKIIITFKL